jgi:FAD synthase
MKSYYRLLHTISEKAKSYFRNYRLLQVTTGVARKAKILFLTKNTKNYNYYRLQQGVSVTPRADAGARAHVRAHIGKNPVVTCRTCSAEIHNHEGICHAE